MANFKFSRDEVILALDVLFQSDQKHLAAEKCKIKELSELLNQLPIHSTVNRDAQFRNETGVFRQIALFRGSCGSGKRDPNVGSLFFVIANEYEDRHEELHRIAQSIRRNIPYFDATYGSPDEASGFPEGALLWHLHCLTEKRESAKIPPEKRCCICQLEPEMIYRSDADLLEQHLTIDPAQMDGKRKYLEKDYITVCPNCHEALHRYRPWLVKENCGELLR